MVEWGRYVAVTPRSHRWDGDNWGDGHGLQLQEKINNKEEKKKRLIVEGSCSVVTHGQNLGQNGDCTGAGGMWQMAEISTRSSGH
jgi:hypothetical protein